MQHADAGPVEALPDEGDSVTRRFLGWYLPVVLIVVVFALTTGWMAERSALTELELPASRVAAQQQTFLEGALAAPAEEVRSLAGREPTLQAQFDAPDPDLDAVADEFFTLLSRNGDHFQIRWIDERGREVVRLDQDQEGRIRRRPASALQDKSARPYVRAGLALQRDQVYVSSLDLNIEGGVLEQPYSPTIRFVARAYDGGGSPRGIIVLNTHADRLLERFRALARPLESFLLNRDGFWLSSPLAADEWGFMLDRPETFAARHGDVWDAMQRRPGGQLVTSSGLWSWRTPSVLPDNTVGDPSLQWKIVNRVPPSAVRQARLLAWGTALGVASLLLAAAGLSLWRLSALTHGRLLAQNAYRREAQLLADANRDLEGAMEAQLAAERELRSALQDLSRAKQATDAARLEAERANEAKSAFLANTSHEIRTPLNAVIGSAYLLGLTHLHAEQRRHIETIDVASRSLLELINDVLDLSKIEAREMTLEPVPFAPIALFGELRGLFEVTARHRGLELLMLPLPEDVPSVLLADARRLRQILVNLIGNAIKFTERGRVTVGVEVADPSVERRRLRLRFWVTDTGIGIPPDRQQKLFAPFVQADASTSRRFGGTGLGLSIVRHLCELMGGRAGVESSEGRGSTFWFEVLVEASAELPDALGTVLEGRPLRVVVADDEVSDRQVIAEFGRQFNWDVDAVADGQALVDHVFREHEADRPVDGLLLDWNMPGMDGVEALKLVRTRLWNDSVPAVLTVSGTEEPALRRLEGAMLADAVLSKPITAATLFNAVNGASHAHGRDLEYVLKRTRIGAAPCYWLYGIRVLVVDDSSINLDVCQRILEHEGASVTVSDSGEALVKRLSNTAGAYDAVLMDIQMPGFDGCETTRRLRMLPVTAAVPIIAFTASAVASEQSRALVAGMNEFLTKPIDPDALVRALRMNIERRRKAPLPVVPRAEFPPVQDEGFPEIEGIDRQFAMRQLSGDRDLFLSLLRRFRQEHEHSAELLAQLMRKGDTAAAADYLHRMCGQAGNLAAGKLIERARALQQALTHERSDADALWHPFAAALSDLLAAISRRTMPRAEAFGASEREALLQ